MVSTDEERISTVRIKPSWLHRLLSLFRSTEYRLEIAHSGMLDKVVVYCNDDELGRILPKEAP